MSLTNDPSDARLRRIRADGQQEAYLVLSDQERSKGFVRPLRRSYKHFACGGVTSMGLALCETYARNPEFYSGTFCAICSKHFPLREGDKHNFEWQEDGQPVGS